MMSRFFFSLLIFTVVLQALGARTTSPSKVPRNAVLLSKISTLTLRSGKYTSHRRVSAVPQLKCTGPSSVCALYDVDVMRCQNQGSDYDDDSVQWTCTASLPPEFKLGSTDVMCEGYESSDDPFVLKGSCGVEYRLALTEMGEEKYGSQTSGWGSFGTKSRGDKVGQILFWCLFLGIAGFMVLSALGCLGNRAGRLRGDIPDGGGSGYDGGGPDDPPPPYDWQPSRKPKSNQSSRSSSSRTSEGQAWRPGFWSGAAGGAAAGYALSNRNRGLQQPAQGGGWFGGGSNNAGEGSSRSSSSPSYSSTRHASTGFGSTSRR